ncbi:MAG: hypothetical protein D6806_13945, partial [Deltaproteobacteria bacterium]
MLVLVLNCGSTSIKARLVDTDEDRSVWQCLVSGVGSAGRLKYGARGEEVARDADVPDLESALRLVLSVLREGIESGKLAGPEAVVHRIGHGGLKYRGATLVDEDVKREIDRLTPLVPLHHPAMLAGIEAAERLLPELPQVAVFDTAEPTFRHRLYPEYKATRAKMPEDMVPQLGRLREVLE